MYLKSKLKTVSWQNHDLFSICNLKKKKISQKSICMLLKEMRGNKCQNEVRLLNGEQTLKCFFS